MTSVSRIACVMAATWLTAGAAQAAIVTVSADTLASNPGVYSGLDGSGTALNVTQAGGGSLATIGSGAFEGLWFGGDQGSGTYTLTFNKALDYFAIHINAMSTFGSFVETIGAFTVNAPGAPSLVFTNIQQTHWDGATVTSGPNDNGEFTMVITPAAGQTFNTISFFHFQSGAPNGSVIRDLSYEIASLGVPEPTTWALSILGFGLMGAALRRRARLAA